MVIEHKEDMKSNFEGTIIDIETIGDFDRRYKNTNDSREYQNMQQVIFGFINKHRLCILCAQGTEAIGELQAKTEDTIGSLEKPFYAFNTHFESGVWFHQFGKIITFEGELQQHKKERKADAVRSLGIENYGDPFYDEGYRCMEAWLNGKFDKAIAHNKACLLKERDILTRRGPYKPDELGFNRG